MDKETANRVQIHDTNGPSNRINERKKRNVEKTLRRRRQKFPVNGNVHIVFVRGIFRRNSVTNTNDGYELSIRLELTTTRTTKMNSTRSLQHLGNTFVF